MIGQKVSHFRIVEKIDEGGMGVVYKAEDENLGRMVALKVLPPDFARDEERRRRFIREARLAASVTHPYIATIHEVDEHDGTVFIAMELVEGRSLQDHLDKDGGLPMREALKFAIEIGEALSGAHDRSIVHRDLKPGNIIIGSDKHVKLLDFGLAKLLEDAPVLGGQETNSSDMKTLVSGDQTREGRIMGTIGYMSPEQARGLSVDARSDIFSLGVVLYETVTGQVPFKGHTATDTLSAILRDPQPPLAGVLPGAPAELERILSKSLEKDPDARYQLVTDMVNDLRALRRTSETTSLPTVQDTSLSHPAVQEGSSWKPMLGIAAAVGLIAIGAVAVSQMFQADSMPVSGQAASGIAMENSLAILPIINMKDSDDPERLGQILQELIITDISGVDSLTVFSSQRLFDIQKQLGKSDGRTISRELATEVARRAGASTMMTGTLSQLGDKWILTAQLVNVADGSVLGSERIDGTDLYSMVDTVTGRIRNHVGVQGSAGAQVEVAVKDKTTDSIEAYQAYLDGVDLLNSLDYEEAVGSFQNAIDIDPAFGQARYKLAIATWWFNPDQQWWTQSEAEPPEEILGELLEGEYKLSRKERMLARAFVPLVARRYDDALPGFQGLVEQYPDDKEAWYGLGESRFHGSRGQRLRSLQAFERAVELDPAFHLAYSHMLNIYTNGRMFDEGLARIRKLIETEPDDLSWYNEYVTLALYKGDERIVTEAIQQAESKAVTDDDKRTLYREMGESYHQVWDDRKAEENYKRALGYATDSKDRANLLDELAGLYLDRREFAEAEKGWRDALEANPLDPAALNSLVSTLIQQRKHDEALTTIRGLMEENPSHPPYYILRIVTEMVSGNLDVAEEIVKEALASSKAAAQTKWVHFAHAAGYNAIGDVVHAKEALGKALEAAPGDLQSIGTLAQIAEETSQWSDLHRLVDQIKEKDPLNGNVLDAELRLLAETGKVDEALERTEEARAKDPLALEWNWRFGYIAAHVATGQKERAAEVLEDALEMLLSVRQKRSFLREASTLHLEVGDYEGAVALAQRAVDLDNQDIDDASRSILGAALTRVGRYDEAGDALNEADTIVPGNMGTQFRKALLLILKGESPQAESIVRDFAENGPIHEAVYRILAYALVGQDRFEDATEYARMSVEMNPGRRARALLAWILIAGDIDVNEGIRVAEEALDTPDSIFAESELFPFMPSAEHSLGLAYLKREEFERAASMLEEAARLRPKRGLIREHLDQAKSRRAALGG